MIYSNLLKGQCTDIDNPCGVNAENTELVYNSDLETGLSSLTAYVDNYYQTNFQVYVPIDTVLDLGGGGLTLQIDTLMIQEIAGLSATGLELECSNDSCVFLGGTNGCFSLTGTPTSSGSYELNLVLYAVLTYDDAPISTTLDDLIQITLNIEECDVEGCWNNDDFYAINEQYWINNCQYLLCEANDNWSNVVTLEECVQEVCDTTYIEVPVYVPVFLTDTIIETEIEYVEVVVVDTIVEIEIEYVEVIVIDTIVEIEIEYVEVVVVDTIVETEIEYVEVIVIDTIVETEIEYVEVVVTDTIVAYQEIIEYVDCDTGLPCEQGLHELIEKSKTDGKIYNLMGQEIRRRAGLYIEDGQIKYLLK